MSMTDAEIKARAGRVAVLMGGPSAERAVSLKSGTAVLEALLRAGVNAIGVIWDGKLLDDLANVAFDRVFIALHGRGGEDGQVQALLGLIGIPYTGSGVLGCALSMDKVRSKRVWQSVGLPTPEFHVLAPGEDGAAAAAAIGYPLVVKPAHEGSSIGVSKVETPAQLAPALALAARYDRAILMERWITGGEYTLSIVDGRALPLIKIETPHAFYDYDAKYHADTTRYLVPCGLDAALEAGLATMGLAAFEAIGASGWGRVDFMLDADAKPWLIEVNMVPGMTDHSLVPMAARAVGMSFDELVLRILATSFEARS